MVNFLAEITSKTDIVVYPTPSKEYSKFHNIYELDINRPPQESYWTEWGGFYDSFTGTQIELYYEQYLSRVNTVEDLFITPFSIYLRDDLTVYIHIPRHTWLFADYATEVDEVSPFLYSALLPDSPSMNNVRNVHAPVKLEVPSFMVKLSDNINGVTLNQGFTISLVNNNAYFDDEIFWNLFNKPVHLKKSVVENPSYEDFKAIRNGLVEDTATTFEKFLINVSDRFRAMGESVCDIITQQKFPHVDITERNLNRNIPIIYGEKRVRLLRLDERHYVAAEYVSRIVDIFDREGNSLYERAEYNRATNTITVSGETDAVDAIIVGYTDNKIGSIITDLVTRKTDIQFTGANWNMGEVNNYINNSYRVNIIINSGDVRGAIQTVLRSDMAYFIQQMDGRFTIRRYGNEYKTHAIPSWLITGKQEKVNSSAQKNYFSSCVINYNFTGADEYSSYLFDERANEAENMYKRRVLRTFYTDLTSQNDARDLAILLSDRFTIIKQTIRLPVGVDTSGYELLDSVEIDLTVNGRKFNRAVKYMVKEIDPAQDILMLEQI